VSDGTDSAGVAEQASAVMASVQRHHNPGLA